MSAEDRARLLVPVPPEKSSSLKRLAEMTARLSAEADLVLLGDSLAAGWPPELYGQAFPGRRVLNLGLPGDRIQNTLWRLGRLDAADLRPREVVLLLGTNNLGDGDAPAAIAAGLLTVAEQLRACLGGPRLILVTVPRRGCETGFRERERLAVNAAVALDLATLEGASLLDSDTALQPGQPDESASLCPDRLHISEAGYGRLSRAVARLLA